MYQISFNTPRWYYGKRYVFFSNQQGVFLFYSMFLLTFFCDFIFHFVLSFSGLTSSHFLSFFLQHFWSVLFRVPQSYVYGSPYMGATSAGSNAGLVPIPATQLSHAAAIAAATNQFYEYQVSFAFYCSRVSAIFFQLF